MPHEIGGPVINPVSAGLEELVLPISTGKNPNAEGARAPCSEEIPHAVADDDAVAYVHPEPFCRREEKIGIRFPMGDPFTCHHGHLRADTQDFECILGVFKRTARGDRSGDGEFCQQPQKFA